MKSANSIFPIPLCGPCETGREYTLVSLSLSIYIYIYTYEFDVVLRADEIGEEHLFHTLVGSLKKRQEYTLGQVYTALSRSLYICISMYIYLSIYIHMSSMLC